STSRPSRSRRTRPAPRGRTGPRRSATPSTTSCASTPAASRCGSFRSCGIRHDCGPRDGPQPRTFLDRRHHRHLQARRRRVVDHQQPSALRGGAPRDAHAVAGIGRGASGRTGRRHVITDFKALLRALAEAGVEFIVIGGVAAAVHGAARATFDLDVVYWRSRDNIGRLVLALTPYHPYLRGAPPGLPFRWDTATVERGLNFTLTTAIGDLDVLGEVIGGGSYDALLASTEVARAFGVDCRLLGLEKLIEVKR